MRVRMLVKISGGRGDGTEWPDPGAEFEVDTAEGAQLCAARLAVPVAQADPVEKAIPGEDDVEKRSAKPAVRARAKPQG